MMVKVFSIIISFDADAATVSDYSEELNAMTEAIRGCVPLYMDLDSSATSVKETAVGCYDIVTDGDINAERYIVDFISKAYPNDSFICEEKKNEPLGDGRTWIIDPIDGTLNYSRGIPMFGTQAVLMVKKRPVASTIYLPVYDEMFTATDALGARLNGKTIHPSRTSKLGECIVSMGDFSRKRHEWRESQSKMINDLYDKVARIKMIGAACTDFAMISCGRTDIHVRFVNNLWDFMPGLYIAEKAGVYYDRDLLDKKKLLVMAPSKDICREFAECVENDIP